MAEDETFIINPKDPTSIVRLQDPTVIEQLLENPPAVLAELLAGWFSSGNGFVAAAGCRIAQGAFKGRVFEQFAREFKYLREKGKIPDDFAEKKYGGKSWVELLTILDEEMPDEDRLEALKAMFYSVNKTTAADGEKILAYQLFQIAKKLNSGQLLLLRSAYDRLGSPTLDDADKWLAQMAQRLGHNLPELVEQDERVLMENRLLTARRPRASVQSNFSTAPIDERGVNDANGRLTGLALRFCEGIQSYRIDLAACAK